MKITYEVSNDDDGVFYKDGKEISYDEFIGILDDLVNGTLYNHVNGCINCVSDSDEDDIEDDEDDADEALDKEINDLLDDIRNADSMEDIKATLYDAFDLGYEIGTDDTKLTMIEALSEDM